MPAHTYEGMFLLDSTKAAAAWDDTVKHVHDILTKHNSEIVASRQWDAPAGLPDRRPQEGDVSSDRTPVYLMVKGLTEPPGSRFQREPAGLVPFSGFEKVAAQMRAIGESVVEKGTRRCPT